MVETSDEDSRPERHGWRPRHPDPALVDPDAAGLRAHRHPPNRLHPFVFMQAGVWVDVWGNETDSGIYVRDHPGNVPFPSPDEQP
ncbi:MAG: hypothetical protein QOH16_3514 [Gaiellaceae bacterium]|nr:hypothetical protein [Gaiellaceae bacterium]